MTDCLHPLALWQFSTNNSAVNFVKKFVYVTRQKGIKGFSQATSYFKSFCKSLRCKECFTACFHKTPNFLPFYRYIFHNNIGLLNLWKAHPVTSSFVHACDGTVPIFYSPVVTLCTTCSNKCFCSCCRVQYWRVTDTYWANYDIRAIKNRESDVQTEGKTNSKKFPSNSQSFADTINVQT